MTPQDALKLAEQDQKFDGSEHVYWWTEFEDGRRYFILQDNFELHTWLMDYEDTITVPDDEDL